MGLLSLRAALASAALGVLCGCGRAGPVAAVDVASPRPLVVFLHGMLEPSATPAATIDPRVEERFREAGLDVWAPVGRAGLCDWSDEAKRATCWPSDERALEAARDLVAGWEPRLASRRVVVVGFSNGGAFATLLAAHGLVRACGFVSLHGFPAGALHARGGSRPPLLLIAGRGAPWEEPQLAATTARLAAFGWTFETKIHDGAHAVNDADVDATLAFVRAVATERCVAPPSSEP